MMAISPSVTNTTQSYEMQLPILIRSVVSQTKSPKWHDVSLYWIDRRIDTQSSEMKQLNEALNGTTIKLFNDNTIAMNYLENQKETSLLIISGKYAVRSLKSIVALSCIGAIIIFCAFPDRYRRLVRQWPTKIFACINTEQELVNKVHSWIDLQCQVNFYMYNPKQDQSSPSLQCTEALFLARYILPDFIMDVPNSNRLQDMLKYCEKNYAKITTISDQIKEFELTYVQTNAIEWYTRHSFIHSMVTHALRSFDRNKIELIAFYIRDLSNQLNQYRMKMESNNSISDVYHGLVMTQHDFHRIQNLSQGSLILMSGFFSTSVKSDVAKRFAETKRSNLDHQKFIEVIFEINLNLKDSPVVCANIKDYSEYPDEEEVLFDLGAIFVFQDVCYNQEEGCWTVRLSLATHDDCISIRKILKWYQSTLDQDYSTRLIDRFLPSTETDDASKRCGGDEEFFSLIPTHRSDFLWNNLSEGYRSFFFQMIKRSIRYITSYIHPDENASRNIEPKLCGNISNNKEDCITSYPQHEPVLFFCFPVISRDKKQTLTSTYSHQYRRFIYDHLSAEQVQDNLERFRSIFYISYCLPIYMENNPRVKFYPSIRSEIKLFENGSSVEIFEQLNNQLLEDLALFYSEEALDLPDKDKYRCIKKCLLKKAAQCYISIAEVAERMSKRYEQTE